MTTEDELKAQKIVESWFWQMSEGHNFRWKNAVKSITLFYESAPLESDVAQLVLEYLRTRSAVTQLVIGHKKWTFDEPGWNTKDAWYQTAPSEQWAGTESKKVRVYWVLVETGDGAADGPYTVENGCKYKVSHSYYWDVSSQPTLPQSSSGIQYTIQGFTRDRETGLFTYIVEKRETVQQDVALYDTAVTAFELSQEEQHLGVTANKVASTGKKASVGNGVMTERHVTKNPDCTSDIVNRVTTEKNVKGAVKTWRKTLRGTVESTTERSAANPLNGSGLEVGETRRSEKTPGELWNNTVEKTTREPVGEIASECQKTIFEHRDVKLENVPTAPAKEAGEAANGVIKQKSVRKTDENTFDVTETTTTEKKVESARTVERKTLRGTSAAVTHRNLTAAEVAAKTGAQLDVGETRTVEKTPGDLKNLTVEKFEPDTQRIKIAEGCEKTAAVETDTTVESVKIEEIGTVHPQTAEVNKRKSVSYRKNEDGKTADRTIVVEKHETQRAVGGGGSAGSTTTTNRTQNATTQEPVAPGGVNVVIEVDNQPNGMGGFNTVRRTTTYKPDMKKATGGSAGHTDTVESGINATSVNGGNGGTNVEVDVSVSPNDHGSASYTKRTRTYHPNVKTASGGSAGHTDTVESGINATSAPGGAGGTNVEVDVSVSPNDHGSASYTKRTRTYKPQMKSATGGTTSRTVTVTSGVNQVDVPNESAATNKEVEVSVSLNDHGSMSTQKRVTEYKPQMKSATGGTTSRTVTVTSGVNQTDVPNDSPAVNKEVDISVSLNDHGSMSTQKRVTTYNTQSATSTSNFETETATTTTTINDTSATTDASMGSASAHPNDHGSNTTQVTEYTPHPVDSGSITWQSVETSPTHTYTYECGLRVFKNLEAVPTPPGSARVQISANINRYGRYDGSIAYSRLVSWTQRDSGGTEDGSQAGSFQYTYVSDYQVSFESSGDLKLTPVFATTTVSTRTYYGQGNKGSEAATAANSPVLPGVSLPDRTYITSSTTSIVQAMKRAEAKLQAALANRKARGT